MNRSFAHFLLALPLITAAQTVTSIADGLWSDPSVWDCSCVPGNGQDIVVMHHLEIEEWVVINSGSLMVMESGYLDGLFSDGSVYLDCEANIYGMIDCNTLQVDVGAEEIFANYGYLTCVYILNERDNFHNAGNIDVSDSLVLHADLTNEPAGYITAAAMGGPGAFFNLGDADAGSGGIVERVVNTGTMALHAWGDAAHVRYLSNTYYFELWGGAVDTVVNTGAIEMTTVHLVHRYEGSGGVWVIPVEQHLIIDSTAHATVSSPGALFVSDGDLRVYGLLDGDGQVCVAHETLNNGAIAGTLDVCDLTPTATDWPLLDVNNGLVESTITFCQAISCTISVPDAPGEEKTELFPVPATGHVDLRGCRPGDHVVVTDLSGRIFLSFSAAGAVLPIPLDGLASGMYLVSIPRPDAIITMRLLVE